jgi:hypothetical protein
VQCETARPQKEPDVQVDSTPPFTSVAQQMGQAAQAPPPPKPGDEGAETVKSATSDDVGQVVDFTA